MKRYKLLFTILLIIPYIQPASYAMGNKLSMVWEIWQLISIMIVVFMYLYKRKSMPKVMIYMICFQAIFIISTVLNGNRSTIMQQLLQGASIVSICMLVEMMIKQDKLLLKAMSIVLGILSLIHIYTMFKYYPIGMYIDELNHNDYYFLGYDNTSFFQVFPFVIYSTCYLYYKNGKNGVLTYLISFIVGFAYLYVKSTTAAIMMIIFIMFLLINDLKFFRSFSDKFLNIKNIIIIVLTIFVFVVFIEGSQYFEKFLIQGLNKNTTLSGRTYIWEQAINYIKQSPIIGYGLESTSVLLSKFNINHVHNIILDIIYKGGIIAFIFYMLMVNCIRKPLMQNKEMFLTKVLSVGIGIYWITGMFDYYNNKYIIFTFFILAVNISKLLGKNDSKELSYGKEKLE